MIVYEPPQAATSIPLIDIRAAGTGDLGALKAVVEEIHRACRDTGFFYLEGHGVPPELMRGQLEWAARFFDLPQERKATVAVERSANRRGYEGLAKQVLDDGSAPDLKESLMLGRELGPEHWLMRRGAPFEGDNPWIEGLPGFREHTERYIAAMKTLGHRLAVLLALSLDLAEHYFDEGLGEPSVSVRHLRYPPTPAAGPQNQLGAGAHTDWGFLTILLQDDCGGLEVRHRDGTWIAAPPVPDTFVVNLGDMVPRMTAGLYASNLHRVLNNLSGRYRHSIATFYNPHFFYSIDVAPTCADAAEPCPPLTFGEHIQEMMSKTYAGAQ